MKQVKIDNVLYVLSIVPYQITQDTSVETIYINCNYLDEFKELNPDLELVPYNYRLLRKSQPPYMPYVDVPDFVDFEFDSSIQNVSSMVDETKTMTLQELHLPDDYTGTVTYKLDGVLLDSSIFTLYDASLYEVLAEIPGTSLYEQDTASYQIIYSKDKYNAEISFAQSTVNVSSYVDSSYTGNIQQVQNAPENVDIKYYLNNSLLDSSVINLTEAGQYQVKAAIVSDELYNDTSTTYTINYVKNKRTASISFANATAEVSTYKDENYTGTIQTLTGVPSGVTAKYYLDSSLLSSNNITISSEGNHIVKGAIEDDSVYNDVSTSYTISYSKVKRDAVLSFANATDSSNVEAGGTFTTTVQNVTGAPQGVSLKYYLNNSLLSDNTITINDVSEGTTSYTVSVKIENDSIYNDTSANYTLQIVGQKPSYQKYECFIKQSANADYVLFNLGYSFQFTQVFDDKYEFNNSIVSASAFNGHGKALPGSSFNTLVFKLKDSTTSTIMTKQNGWSADIYLPSKQFTDVIDIPENVRTMISWDSKNNSTINKLIIRSPYLYTGNAPGNVSSNIKIYVPEDSLQNYKTSNKWRSVSTYLYGSDFSKDFLTIRFLEDTIDVSTMTGQNYNGTLQNYYGIPNGVPVKFYLDSSLLNSSSYTLTTAGTHTILAEISNNSSYYDTSTVYTINYTQVAPPSTELYPQSDLLEWPEEYLNEQGNPVGCGDTLALGGDQNSTEIGIPQANPQGINIEYRVFKLSSPSDTSVSQENELQIIVRQEQYGPDEFETDYYLSDPDFQYLSFGDIAYYKLYAIHDNAAIWLILAITCS